MAAVPFDTLKLARRLEGAGLSSQQAGGGAESLAEAMSGAELATGADIDELRGKIGGVEQSLRAEIESLEQRLRGDLGGRIDAVEARLDLVRAELKTGIELVRRDTIIWLGDIIVVAVGGMLAAMRLLLAGHP
jgi:hypothetical protein